MLVHRQGLGFVNDFEARTTFENAHCPPAAVPVAHFTFNGNQRARIFPSIERVADRSPVSAPALKQFQTASCPVLQSSGNQASQHGILAENFEPDLRLADMVDEAGEPLFTG